VQLAVDDETSANPRSNRDVKHRATILSCSKRCLGQRSAIAVVAKNRGDAELLLAPSRQRHVVPTGNLNTLNDSSECAVHGSTKPDADALHGVSRYQLVAGVFDLSQDTGGTFGNVYIAALERHESAAIAGTDTKLQLGPTDFNSED
jgi:hypothetical protein